MANLGTLEELPQEYRDTLSAKNLLPLWPNRSSHNNYFKYFFYVLKKICLISVRKVGK